MNNKQLDDNYQSIVICAVRYGLGRRTYIVGIICDYLRNHMMELTNKTKRTIACDIELAIVTGKFGDNCDKKEWLKVLRVLEDEIKCRD